MLCWSTASAIAVLRIFPSRASVGHTCVSSRHSVRRGGLIDRGIDRHGSQSRQGGWSVTLSRCCAAEIANLIAMAWKAESKLLPRRPLTVCYVNPCGESVCCPSNRAPGGFQAVDRRPLCSVRRRFRQHALLRGRSGGNSSIRFSLQPANFTKSRTRLNRKSTLHCPGFRGC
jgi:hypothetical protein